MNTWIVLLRGINVGGHNKLPMADLRAALTGAGFGEVQTYIQSGNVVLSADAGLSAVDVRESVKFLISCKFGHDIQVMVLSAVAVKAAAKANPFADNFEKPNWMFLTFLESKPRAPDLDSLHVLVTDNERLALIEDVFYFYAGDGAGRSKVMAKTERALGVSGTARNWNTVQKLLVMTGETDG